MVNERIQFAGRFDGVTGSAIREIFKMLAKPGIISFAGGNPSPDALPCGDAADIARDVLLSQGKRILQYGATEGYPPLLNALPAYIEDRFGFTPDPGEVLPTTGSTQAMDLLCRALIEPGDVILVESPTFLGNMQCMRLYGARLVSVQSDENGMMPDALEQAIRTHHPKMIYIIPTFQNPTGITLSGERRPVIAALAEKYGVIVAEDDPYRDLRYAGEALPSIKHYDKAGFVAHMGSFSKVISPGLRVGYLSAPANLLRKCVIGKQSSDVHTSNLSQAICAEYITRGLLAPHITEICRMYGAQLEAMLRGLRDFPLGTAHTVPQGGLFVFVTLPERVNAADMLAEAVEKGVAYVPGTYFYTDGGHDNTLRLNFSMSAVDDIERGMSILRDIVLNRLSSHS